MNKLKIAVLASGNGTIIPEIEQEFSIDLVITNKPNAPVLKNAKKLGIKAVYAKDEQEINALLQQHQIDLVLLAGYMKILSKDFVAKWRNKILNVHPSLLPKFAGLMDLKVHEAVLKSGEKQTGCTVHFADEILDGGKIILQKTCEVSPNDSPETLKSKVQRLEGPAMIEAIKTIKPIEVKRALISVSDKQGVIEFAKGLHKLGIEIISTGGTAKKLQQANIPVIAISDVTGFPEIMQGRVKTLHPKIHGGILGKRDDHAQEAAKNQIEWIDLVVCNLYPFAETIKNPESTLSDAIENIDIGGPSMIRSAAKNFNWVGVISSPSDYEKVLQELKTQKGLSLITRENLAAKAFAHTAEYDAMIANYLNEDQL